MGLSEAAEREIAHLEAMIARLEGSCQELCVRVCVRGAYRS